MRVEDQAGSLERVILDSKIFISLWISKSRKGVS